ncbi:MAG TPA: hypothetical protein VMY05_02460 [Acidobacteriota bacterium]|nr:hypothetical protein [Acidobacteriota bacterium]
MKLSARTRSLLPAAGILVLFAVFAVFLFARSFPARRFTENGLIYDLIWMDAWAVMFFAAVIAVWVARLRWRARVLILLGCLSVYGVIEMALMYAGTPYNLYGFLGDQLFRHAMIVKFVRFIIPGDYYYKSLPVFYPPVYYYLLSLYARLFSVEAYKMLKIGSMLIYFVGPFLLYWFWRKLVGPLQAFLITLGNFLVCSFGIPYVQSVPHAFLANSLFIPWWLFYIERVKNTRTSWQFYLTGGIIGAVIFSTYFYPFFIGGFLLLARLVLGPFWKYVNGGRGFRWKSALGVLVVAAILSMPYWLPVVVSIAQYGIDRSRGGWHHLGCTGVIVKYMEFSVPGLLFLGAIVYALRRYTAPLWRGLLLLLGSVVFFLLVGSVLGALTLPVNLIKAKDFVHLLWGPFVGLAAAGVIRRARLFSKARIVVPVLLSLVLLVFLHNINGLGNEKMVRVARESVVPTWGTDASEMAARAGTVFLTGHYEFTSFYPVYTFIATSELYSHPAARFAQRYELLGILQGFSDPYIFHTVLRHNIFDPVNYYMPRRKDSLFLVQINWSNYPDRFTTRYLQYDTMVVSDTALFVNRPGMNLYEVVDPGGPPADRQYNFTGMSVADSLLFLARVRAVTPFLDSVGQRLLGGYVNVDRAGWHEVPIPGGAHAYQKQIELRSCVYTSVGDSTYFVMNFLAREDVATTYRVFLHLFEGGQRSNRDFWPERPTSTWKKLESALCVRAVPRLGDEFTFSTGFFRGENRLGEAFDGRSAADTL